MKVRTIFPWTEPDGKTVHEQGEIADVTVFDLNDLIAHGTVEPVIETDDAPTLVVKGGRRSVTVPAVPDSTEGSG